MSRFKLSVFIVMLAAFAMPALAGEKAVKRVPAGAAAFHFVFELSNPFGPTPEFMGYIAFIEGVDGDFDGNLFNGPASKDTAYFTIYLNKPIPGDPLILPTPDPALVPLLYPRGAQFTVYFNPYPESRDWNTPGSFTQGVSIAVFEESALLSTGAQTASFNVFSSRLIDSTPINFNGQRIDFRKLVPNGVTVTNFGNGISPRDRSEYDYSLGASGGGTAIALGGKLRRDSNDDDSDD